MTLTSERAAALGGLVPIRTFRGEPCPLVVVGVWQLSSGHSTQSDSLTEDERLAVMAEHAELGLCCFDCADIYTGVEELLGKLVARGSAMRIHTKCVPDLDMIKKGCVSSEYIEVGVLRSLNRLNVLAVDLVQFCWWDYQIQGAVQAYASLCELKVSGFVKEVGLTNTDLPHLRELIDAGHIVASNQVQFSLLDRRPSDSGMTKYCTENGIVLLCYGVLAGGFLTNRWLGASDPGFDSLENRSLVKYRLIIDEYGSWEDFQRLLELMAKIAASRQTNISGVAIGWVLRQQCDTRVILGARSSSHARQMVSAAQVVLLEEDIDALNAEVGNRGIKGEVWGAEGSVCRHTGAIGIQKGFL